MGEETQSTLDRVRDEVTEILASAEEFPSGAVAIGSNPGEMIGRIDEALAKLGRALVVLPPEPVEAEDTNDTGVVFFPKVELRTRVFCNLTLTDPNGMQGRAMRDAVMRLLQGRTLSTPGVESPLWLARRPQEKTEFQKQTVYDVIFNFASHL